jgi:hypothetical protein
MSRAGPSLDPRREEEDDGRLARQWQWKCFPFQKFPLHEASLKEASLKLGRFGIQV